MDRSKVDALIARIAGPKSSTFVPIQRAPRQLEDAPNLFHDLVWYLLIEDLIAGIHIYPKCHSTVRSHIIFLCRIHPPLFAAPLRLHVRNLLDLDHTHRGIHLAPDLQTFLVCSLLLDKNSASRLQELHIPILSTLLKARIQICTNYAFIQLSASNIFHTIQGVLVIVVLDEAKSTWCLVKSIQAHYKSFDLSTSSCISALSLKTWKM